MLNLIRYLLAAVAIGHLAPAQALAQECDKVLVGIYTYSFVRSSNNMSESVLSKLDEYEVSTSEQAESTATNLGIRVPIKKLPVELQYGTHADRSNKGIWAKKVMKYLASNKSVSQSFESALKTANKDVIDGWVRCIEITSNKGGLRIVPKGPAAGDGNEFALLVSYLPSAAGVKNVLIKEFVYDPEAITLGEPISKIEGRSVPLSTQDPTVIVVKRNSMHRGATHITIRTNVKGYEQHVKLAPLPNIYKSAPKAPIVETKADFDGDRLPDKMGPCEDDRLPSITLGSGKVVTPQRAPGLRCDPQGVWLTGDFDGDGLTDIVYIVRSLRPGRPYFHYYVSDGDGHFQGRGNKNGEFDMQDANAGVAYSAVGAWDTFVCPGVKFSRHVLRHTVGSGSLYWTLLGTGSNISQPTGNCGVHLEK